MSEMIGQKYVSKAIRFDRELPKVLDHRIRICLELPIIQTNFLGPEELGLNELQ